MFDYETIVISLPGDKNRRGEVQKEFEDAQMDFRFFDAVDGRKLDQTPPEYDQKTRKQRYGFDLTPGEIGCFLSHREVWKTCIRQQKIFLVLEDDFKINCNLSQVLKYISMMKEHWDLMRLHGIREKNPTWIPIISCGDFSVVEELRAALSSAAYLLTPEGARKLVYHSEKFHVPVDNFIEARYIHRTLTLSVIPNPVATKDISSTIGNRKIYHKTLLFRLRRLVFRAVHDVRKYIWMTKIFLQRKYHLLNR